MNQYKWTHELQTRKNGFYEVRYLAFANKVFYYAEIKRQDIKEYAQTQGVNRLLCLLYSSQLSENKFIVKPLEANSLSILALKQSKTTNDYLFSNIKKDAVWTGKRVVFPYNVEDK